MTKMVARLSCWFLGLAFVVQTANAANYLIRFSEGAYAFDGKSTPDEINNKYLASVTVMKDSEVIADGLRGSTLPDAWAFYQRWNVELKRTDAPSDSDIVSMFEYFQKLTATNAKLGATKVADIAAIFDLINRVPAIKSGEYSFVMGLHKNGKSVHGRPYAPRLLGGSKEKPYDPDDSKSKATVLGGFIRTLNPNNALNQQYIATGINVHDGRILQDYKDSEGCLTLRPEDWPKFYGSLPSPEQWKAQKHTGVIIISRGLLPPNAPKNLRTIK